MKLKDIGYDDWFESKFQSFYKQGFNPVRITAVNKNNFLLRNEKAEIYAELAGKFMFKMDSAFYQVSYLEKRNRDKSFGKMYRQVMKNNRKK